MKIFNLSTREGYGQFVSFVGIGGRFKSGGTVGVIRNVIATLER